MPATSRLLVESTRWSKQGTRTGLRDHDRGHRNCCVALAQILTGGSWELHGVKPEPACCGRLLGHRSHPWRRSSAYGRIPFDHSQVPSQRIRYRRSHRHRLRMTSSSCACC